MADPANDKNDWVVMFGSGARDIAMRALSQTEVLRTEAVALKDTLAAHLKECGERYQALQSLFIRVSFAIVTLLLSIIGWLIAHPH